MSESGSANLRSAPFDSRGPNERIGEFLGRRLFFAGDCGKASLKWRNENNAWCVSLERNQSGGSVVKGSETESVAGDLPWLLEKFPCDGWPWGHSARADFPRRCEGTHRKSADALSLTKSVTATVVLVGWRVAISGTRARLKLNKQIEWLHP